MERHIKVRRTVGYHIPEKIKKEGNYTCTHFKEGSMPIIHNLIYVADDELYYTIYVIEFQIRINPPPKKKIMQHK